MLLLMTTNIIIAPRFTPGEIEIIDRAIEKGHFKSRTEFVRMSAKAQMERIAKGDSIYDL